MLTDVRLVQLLNPLITGTELGIVTEVRLMQSRKASCILVTVKVRPLYSTSEGMVTFPA